MLLPLLLLLLLPLLAAAAVVAAAVVLVVALLLPPPPPLQISLFTSRCVVRLALCLGRGMTTIMIAVVIITTINNYHNQ